jgi:hypothetical protein
MENKRLRSVLSHPLGLPLVSFLHGNNPSKLQYLPRESNLFPSGNEADKFDDLFSKAVSKWKRSNNRDETGLPKILSGYIEAKSKETHFHSTHQAPIFRQDCTKPFGYIDILLSPEPESSTTPSTPLAIIEVGRDGSRWWKKVNCPSS